MLTIFLCAVLGALTTLAVAWACAAWIDPNRAPYSFTATAGSNNTWQGESIQTRFGHTRINRTRLIDLTRDPTTGAIQTIGVRGGDLDAVSVDLNGWPWRAMRSVNLSEITIGNGTAVMQTRAPRASRRVGILELSPWSSRGMSTWRALPDQPMWLGFAIDTLLYAALWWFIIFGWRRHRRARSIRRGLCPQCGYDQRGQTSDQRPCPECGWSRAPRQA